MIRQIYKYLNKDVVYLDLHIYTYLSLHLSDKKECNVHGQQKHFVFFPQYE